MADDLILKIGGDNSGVQATVADTSGIVDGFVKKTRQGNDQLSGSAASLGTAFKGAFSLMAAGATAALAGATALAAGVVALGQRGSTVADVRDQFTTLNSTIGNTSGAVLSQLQRATAGTISTFDLMKATNVALSSGLQLNQQQFGLTGEAARVLADRVGGDTTDAYTALLSAMASGKDASLTQIGLNIDGAAAVQQYAASLGVETSALSEAEIIGAKRNAILAEMTRVLGESGAAEVDFADRVDQAKTALADAKDELAEAIANSPVFAAALDGIASALSNAFGDSQSDLIQNVVGLLEDGVLMVADLGQVGLSSADAIVRGFYLVRAVFFDALTALFDLELGLKKTSIGFLEFASDLPGATDDFKRFTQETRAGIDANEGMANSFRQSAAEAHKNAEGHNNLSKILQTTKGVLADVKSRMEAARKEHGETKTATDATTTASNRLVPSITAQGNAFREAKGKTEEHKKALAEHEKQTKALQDTLEKVNLAQYFERIDPASRSNQREIEKVSNLIGMQVDQLRDELLPALDEIPVVIGRALTPQEQQASRFQRLVEHAYEYKAAVRDSGDEIDAVREKLSQVVSVEERWKTGLSDITESFAQLAQIGGEGLDGLIGRVGELIGLMNVGSQAGGQLAGVFRNKDAQGNPIAFGQEGAGFNLNAFRTEGGQFTAGSIAGGAAGAAPGVIAGIGALSQATDVAGRGNRALRGATTGAGIGMQFGGPYGALIGAGVGALVGALRNPAFEDVMKRVGHEWGAKISEETARGIADTAKTLFKGDRQAAEIFSMDKILGESGGITDQNIDKMTGKLHDVFSMIEMGKFTTEQATEVLEKNFGAFAEYYTSTGQLVSAEFAHIIQLNDEFGTKSQAVREFITGQLDQGASGFATWLQTGAAALDGIAEKQTQIADLERQAAAASDTDRPRIRQQIEAISAALEEEKKIHAAVGVTTQESAEAAGAALGAMFAEYIEGGATTTEALAKIGPAAEGLRTQLQQAGLDGGEAFTQITRLADIAKDRVAGPALDAVSGLNGGLKSLHNTGLLNQTMFSGLTSQVARTRDTIVAQGHDGEDAMRLMQPTLQTIWELQQKFGYTTDAATQELLTQAEAAGLVGDKQKDANEKAADAMSKAADKMGELVDQLAKMTSGADRAASGFGRVRDAVNAIPREVTVEVNGEYNAPQVPGDGYATGTRGRHQRWFMDFGQGYTTRVHGMEAIVPYRDRFDFAMATLAEIQSSVGTSSGLLAFPAVTDGGSAGRSLTIGTLYVDARNASFEDPQSMRQLALVIKRELEQEFLTKVQTGVRS